MRCSLDIVAYLAILLSILVNANANKTQRALLTCSSRSKCMPYDQELQPISVKDEFVSFLNKNCFCDKKCALYGDCCKDAKRPNKKPSKNFFKCVNKVEIDPFREIYVVSSCPSSFKELLINEKCSLSEEDKFYDMALYTEKENIIYRNYYCTICHGVQNKAKYFKLKMESRHKFSSQNKTESLKLLKQFLVHPNSEYKVRYVWDNSTFNPRYCKINVNSCPEKASKKQKKKCKQSSVNYVYQSIAYKNKHCAKCNNVTNFKCKDPRIGMPNILLHETTNFRSYSILFDFSGPGTRVGGGVELEINKCKPNFVHDPLNNICRKLYCSINRQYVNGKCRLLTDSSIELTTYDSILKENTTYMQSKIFNDNEKVLPPVNINIGQSIQQGTEKSFFDCPMIALSSFEYSILENGSLHYFNDGSLHASGHYMIKYEDEKELMLICSPYIETFVFKKKFSGVQAIISLVGLLISMVCLLMHFVVYLLLGSLRKNLPGKLQMCLVISLFFGQLLFLFNAEDLTPILCRCVGMAMHYFLLSSFFWMNVLAFDLWSTFSSPMATVVSGSKKRLIFYNLYAWMSPAIIVGCAVFIENFIVLKFPSISQISPRYGDNDMCWINNKLALIAFFVVPSLLLITVNIVFFIITVISLHRIAHETVLVRRQKQSQVILYVKLSVLMGGTWTISYIAGLVDKPFLWYIFIVLNCLQGFYMFISFICTKKVLHMLQEICRPEKKFATVGTGHYNGHKQHLVSSSSKVQTKDTYVDDETLVISSHETCI